MKKTILNILIVLLPIVPLNAQEIASDNEKGESLFIPKNVIKIFPLTALAGIIGLGYERVIKPKTSVNFTLFQQFNEPNFENNIYERNYHLFFETAVRRYLSKQKKTPKGWFASSGLLTEYNYNEYKNNPNNVERLWVGASGRTGYQWVFKKALKGISTEVLGGIDYKITTGIFEGGTSTILSVNINFTIGYSW